MMGAAMIWTAMTWAPAALAGGDCGASSEDAAHPGLGVGPAAVSLWDGDLGRARRACPLSQVGAGPRGLVLVDNPAFYGQIVASALVDASVALDERTEVWLRLEPVRWQNVISAIPASSLGYGFTSLGALRRVDGAGPSTTALLGQLVLPSAIGLQGHSLPFGLSLAVTTDRPLSERWSLHGQLGGVSTFSLSRGPSQPRLGLVGTYGAMWRAGRGFALVLDAQAAMGQTAPLDHLAVAPAVRLASGRLGFELAAAVPVAGRERALAVVELHTTVSF